MSRPDKERRESDHWTVDKRVPLALILILFSQTLGATWWAATMTSRVQTMEENAVMHKDLPNRILRTEILLSQLEKTLNRLNSTLQSINDKR